MKVGWVPTGHGATRCYSVAIGVLLANGVNAANEQHDQEFEQAQSIRCKLNLGITLEACGESWNNIKNLGGDLTSTTSEQKNKAAETLIRHSCQPVDSRRSYDYYFYQQRHRVV